METFCVGKKEIKEWKRIVNVMKSQCNDIVTLPPSHYLEIAKLPQFRQLLTKLVRLNHGHVINGDIKV